MLLLLFIGNILNAQPVKPATSGYAPINGLKMYYETYGEGSPIVLLHGSFMNIQANFGEIIPALSKTHKVIALELQGHGRTADISRPLSFPALAGDVAALLAYLKVDSAAVLGYSLGATIALELTLQHPKLVTRLVFISSAYNSDGWIQPVRDAFAMMSTDMISQSPLKGMYNQLAPDTAHWKIFVTNMLNFNKTPFDLGIDRIKKIKAPLLIIKGDNDGIDYAHIASLYAACGGNVFADMAGLPKSQLAVLPGASHVGVMMQTERLINIIVPFVQ
ncbi:alpha/beta hydrolase [Deminuibacter soli]|uniref:Alpha/beta hydrolase n=1 Tax=Deminuibacter soli TaxID=2291815 RepID=A0A3E1NG65_9BACT|nr:alpha/beta hydrolase [Deminuibacter soli]